jgi:hypothetical protein
MRPRDLLGAAGEQEDLRLRSANLADFADSAARHKAVSQKLILLGHQKRSDKLLDRAT